MAKGTVTINPFYADRSLMNPVAVAGLLTTVLAHTESHECNTFILFMNYQSLLTKLIICCIAWSQLCILVS
jgi:26S proteasome regulatory subunit N1